MWKKSNGFYAEIITFSVVYTQKVLIIKNKVE
jgi:hypothetical protein